MSAPSRTSIDYKAFLQELKTNRKTQAALVMMILVLGYTIYSLVSDKPKARPKTGGRVFATSSTGDRSFQTLSKLPNLAQLNQAGELPDEQRMYRDLFTFEAAKPKPVEVKEPPPPPPLPPPTPEQLAEQERKRLMDEQMNLRPQSLRYLGYMGTPSSGRLGDFVKGEDAITIRLGELANPTWRLITVTENYAEFQNLKYPDMRYRAEASDRTQSTNTPSNEF